MAKTIRFRQGLSSVLFWSIIAAAFIGPGTVTTASRAGSAFRFELLWALVFSIFATIVLQEAAARITIASGKSLGEIVSAQYRSGRALRYLLCFAVVFGCAAYEAGNILGALAGLHFFTALPARGMVVLLGLICAMFLWLGSFQLIARFLGMVVAGMGLLFVLVAARGELSLVEALRGMRPTLPPGGAMLVIGLIGTTIVPYNLFLASGIGHGQSVLEMRWGIALAVLIGGLISIAIMAVGVLVGVDFSFEALAQALARQAGAWANAFFGLGLFVAGVTSAITAPLAAGIAARSLLAEGENQRWGARGWKFRATWALVLLAGLLFGFLGVQPIPAIILAQAINGVLLPVVAIFLLFAVNDRQLIPAAHLNTPMANSLFIAITGVVCFLGLHNLGNAAARLWPPLADWPGGAAARLGLAALISGALAWWVFRRKR
jgi:manganese transport protein